LPGVAVQVKLARVMLAEGEPWMPAET